MPTRRDKLLGKTRKTNATLFQLPEGASDLCGRCGQASRDINLNNLLSKITREPPLNRAAGAEMPLRQMAFLQDRFDLTRAEARLVVHLAKGSSLKSSANELGVGYETVRHHLKSAFLKTRTHRQAELLLVVIRALDDMRE
jgi:DNA-binding CsgD family transcriptional regulator